MSEVIGENTFLKLRQQKDQMKAELEQVKIQRDIALRKQKKLEAEQLKKEKEEQKEKEKEEARIKKAEERILKKQREEQEKINQAQQPRVAPQPQTGFTREDMEKAMFSAISSYETIRKAEKAEKKKRELAEARERQMTRTLQQAIQPNKPPDQWRQFFS